MMQKSRLGIGVGLLGAAVYLMGLYGGALVTTLMVGYVLLFEENEWLKRSAVKAFVLMVAFSLLTTLVYLIPNVISMISYIAGIFGESFYVESVSNLAAAISSLLDLLEKFLFIVLALKGLTLSNFRVPVVDQLVNMYME